MRETKWKPGEIREIGRPGLRLTKRVHELKTWPIYFGFACFAYFAALLFFTGAGVLAWRSILAIPFS